MEIRRAEPDDGDAVADVFVAARAEMSYLPPVDVDGVRRFICDTVVARYEAWVAMMDGEIVGFAALDGDDLELLYVRPQSQGRGIGTTLFDHVRQVRPGGITFWVFQRNEGARRFYERHGCVVLELTDGQRNMEHEPDMRYAWRP